MFKSGVVQFSFLLVVWQWIDCSAEANILALISASSPSHHIMHTTILKELAVRGHNVTVLSALPRTDGVQLPPTYHHVYLELSDANDWSAFRTKMLNNDSKSDFTQMARIPLLMKMLSHRSNEILQHETVRQLMQSRRQFDLFVLGYHFNEPLLGIAGHFRCPSVIISTSPAMKSIRDFAGSPASIATTPIFSKIGKRDHNPPTFWERFGLFIAYTLEYIIVLIVTQFLHKPIYAKHFPTAIGYPTYDEVQTNVSLVLVNHHFSHGDFRPVYPNIVDIGGIQIRAEPEPLSEPIASFVHGAEHGFILFSMGSNLKMSEMKREKFEMFLNVLGKLKQRVILKYESDDISVEDTENILLAKWLPQNDLLAQTNIRFFISHCGLGAIGEAKFHGVPILAMPVYGDQLGNARQSVADGWAVQLDVDSVTHEQFANAIDEMLANQTYTENVQRISKLYRDRPESPLEAAVYWIEYVLRHRGARHMQSAMVHLNFFQRNLIDVFALFGACAYGVAKLAKIIYKKRLAKVSVFICIAAAAVHWCVKG